DPDVLAIGGAADDGRPFAEPEQVAVAGRAVYLGDDQVPHKTDLDDLAVEGADGAGHPKGGGKRRDDRHRGFEPAGIGLGDPGGGDRGDEDEDQAQGQAEWADEPKRAADDRDDPERDGYGSARRLPIKPAARIGEHDGYAQQRAEDEGEHDAGSRGVDHGDQ